jgi:hypothetical protein
MHGGKLQPLLSQLLDLIFPVFSPDMTPQALMAAHNLPQYDAVYERLRTEYLEVRKPIADERERS